MTGTRDVVAAGGDCGLCWPTVELSGWVVGNSRIRAVSSNWAGWFAHLRSIGWLAKVIRDETVVEAACPVGTCALAKVRPAAEARITMQLSTSRRVPCRDGRGRGLRPLRRIPDSLLARALEQYPETPARPTVRRSSDRGTRTSSRGNRTDPGS